MAKNTNTALTFTNDLKVALETMTTLNLKGDRPKAVLAFVSAANDAERQEVVEVLGAGLVRRGLRQVAQRFERKGDQDTADVFWALRDDIDEVEETVFTIEAA